MAEAKFDFCEGCKAGRIKRVEFENGKWLCFRCRQKGWKKTKAAHVPKEASSDKKRFTSKKKRKKKSSSKYVRIVPRGRCPGSYTSIIQGEEKTCSAKEKNLDRLHPETEERICKACYNRIKRKEIRTGVCPGGCDVKREKQLPCLDLETGEYICNNCNRLKKIAAGVDGYVHERGLCSGGCMSLKEKDLPCIDPETEEYICNGCYRRKTGYEYIYGICPSCNASVKKQLRYFSVLLQENICATCAQVRRETGIELIEL